jgi:protocatechuate 3,4-dioxygenase beta subunit
MSTRLPISRRAFLQMSLPVVLAACGAPATAPSAPTATQPAPTEASPAAPTSTAAAAAETTAAPASAATAMSLPATPPCGDDDDPTPAQTEGPYYTPNTPERTSLLEAGLTGTRLAVTGYVLTTGCQPVAQALLDFWHADDAGQYDNVGYRLRGHQFTDEQGRYTLETIVPGLYPGRTRHIHVKVQAPNQPVLTTQLYFPDEPGNLSDGIFNPVLVMEVQAAADGRAASFNFVLNM